MASRWEALLFAVLGIAIYSAYEPRTSIGVNVFHWGQRAVDAITRSPIHSITEHDTAGLARLRYMYSLMGVLEPRAKAFKTEILVRSSIAGHDIPVTIYKNARCQLEICPLVLFFHGGGFVIGDVPGYEHITTVIADAADVVVAAVEYRLAPEHKFPAGHDDCLEASAWVLANAASMNADPRRVAVVGDSAGGNLASVVSWELRDRVHLAILVYPVISFSNLMPSTVENAHAPVLPLSTKAWFQLMHFGKGNDHIMKDPKSSPLNKGPIPNPSEFPITHIMTAELDILRDDGEDYAAFLAAQGVRVSHRRYNGTVHGFFGSSLFPHGRTGLNEAISMIRTHFCDNR